MARKESNRPAILGIVEKAFGGTGEVKQERIGDSDSAYMHSKDKASDPPSAPTKAPGQAYGGGRKGPRKAPASPPRRPPRRP